MKKKISKKKSKPKTDSVAVRLDRLEQSISQLINVVEQLKFTPPHFSLNGEKNYPHTDQPMVRW